MRTRSLSHEALVLRLADAFRIHGYDGVTLNELARSAGLNKASLYHFFPGGKEEMALATLNLAHAWIGREIVDVLKSGVPGSERIRTVNKALDAFYENGQKACLLELMVASTAGEKIKTSIRTSFSELMKGFEDFFRELGWSAADARSKAEVAIVCIQGSLILSRALKNSGPFKRQLKTLEISLSEPPPSDR